MTREKKGGHSSELAEITERDGLASSISEVKEENNEFDHIVDVSTKILEAGEVSAFEFSFGAFEKEASFVNYVPPKPLNEVCTLEDQWKNYWEKANAYAYLDGDDDNVDCVENEVIQESFQLPKCACCLSGICKNLAKNFKKAIISSGTKLGNGNTPLTSQLCGLVEEDVVSDIKTTQITNPVLDSSGTTEKSERRVKSRRRKETPDYFSFPIRRSIRILSSENTSESENKGSSISKDDQSEEEGVSTKIDRRTKEYREMVRKGLVLNGRKKASDSPEKKIDKRTKEYREFLRGQNVPEATNEVEFERKMDKRSKEYRNSLREETVGVGKIQMRIDKRIKKYRNLVREGYVSHLSNVGKPVMKIDKRTKEYRALLRQEKLTNDDKANSIGMTRRKVKRKRKNDERIVLSDPISVDKLNVFVDNSNYNILRPLPSLSRARNKFPHTWQLVLHKDKTWQINSDCGEIFTSLKKAIHFLRVNKGINVYDQEGENEIMELQMCESSSTRRKWEENGDFQEKNASTNTQSILDSAELDVDDPIRLLSDCWKDPAPFFGALPVWDNDLFVDSHPKADPIDEGMRIKQNETSLRTKRVRRSTGTLPSEVDKHSMVEPKYYSNENNYTNFSDTGMKQPFDIKVHPQVPFLVDFHSSLSKEEIIGVFGGKYVDGVLYIQSALPCLAISSGGTDVEVDPVDLTKVLGILQDHDLSFVGWYHSHPAFDPFPSTIDIRNQYEFQHLFKLVNSDVEPFVGLIVRPPARKNSFAYEHTWFHIQRVNQRDKHYHQLLSRGYSGITLSEDLKTGTGTFCMRLHACVRLRRTSYASMVSSHATAIQQLPKKYYEYVEYQDFQWPAKDTLKAGISRLDARLDGIISGICVKATMPESNTGTLPKYRLWCQRCSKFLQVRANHQRENEVDFINDILERHIVNPIHSYHAQGSKFSSQVHEITPTNNETTMHSTEIVVSQCLCRHFSKGSFSVGTLTTCEVDLLSCGGKFHSTCCHGGYRLQLSEETNVNGVILKDNQITCSLCASWIKKKVPRCKFNALRKSAGVEGVGSITFEEDLPAANRMNARNQSSAKIILNEKYSEIRGMVSQVQSFILYYSSWHVNRRVEITRKRLPSAKVSQQLSTDFCDKMRLALSHHLASIMNHDHFLIPDDVDNVMDLVIRYSRYHWRRDFKQYNMTISKNYQSEK